MNMITDITPEQVLTYLDSEIQKLETRLVSEYGHELKNNGGLAYYVDEEDGFLEYVGTEINQDFTQIDEPMLKVLKYWTNERTVYPREWIIWAWNQLINKENGIE